MTRCAYYYVQQGKHMNIRCILVICLIAQANFGVYAGDVQIIDFQESPGRLTWQNAETNGVCNIQWAASMEGPWQSNWSSQIKIPATSLTQSVAVPMFYRVCWVSNSSTAAISENFDGQDWRSMPLPSWTNIAVSGRWVGKRWDSGEGPYVGSDTSRAHSADRYVGYYGNGWVELPALTASPTQIVLYARASGADGSNPLRSDNYVTLMQKIGSSTWSSIATKNLTSESHVRIEWNVSFGEPTPIPILEIGGCNAYLDDVEIKTKP